jgi:hypothetical protein
MKKIMIAAAVLLLGLSVSNVAEAAGRVQAPTRKTTATRKTPPKTTKRPARTTRVATTSQAAPVAPRKPAAKNLLAAPPVQQVPGTPFGIQPVQTGPPKPPVVPTGLQFPKPIGAKPTFVPNNDGFGPGKPGPGSIPTMGTPRKKADTINDQLKPGFQPPFKKPPVTIQPPPAPAAPSAPPKQVTAPSTPPASKAPPRPLPSQKGIN